MITKKQANELLNDLTDEQIKAIGDFQCGTLSCDICPFNIEGDPICFSVKCTAIKEV